MSKCEIKNPQPYISLSRDEILHVVNWIESSYGDFKNGSLVKEDQLRKFLQKFKPYNRFEIYLDSAFYPVIMPETVGAGCFEIRDIHSGAYKYFIWMLNVLNSMIKCPYTNITRTSYDE